MVRCLAGARLVFLRLPSAASAGSASASSTAVPEPAGRCYEERPLAIGTLRLISLPPLGGTPRLGQPRRKVERPLGFLLPGRGSPLNFLLPEETVFYLMEGCLVFEAPRGLLDNPCVLERPPSPGRDCTDFVGLAFEQPTCIELVAEIAAEHGYSVRWQAHSQANGAARGIDWLASLLAEGILGTARLTGYSLRATGRAVGASELLEGAVAAGTTGATGSTARLPDSSSLSGVRTASESVASVATVAADSVTAGMGWLASRIAESLPDFTQQWQEDVRVVGRSGIGAGVKVLVAVTDATAHVFRECADTSTEVVGCRYGPAAACTTRDGFEVLGNTLQAANKGQQLVVPTAAAVGWTTANFAERPLGSPVATAAMPQLLGQACEGTLEGGGASSTALASSSVSDASADSSRLAHEDAFLLEECRGMH